MENSYSHLHVQVGYQKVFPHSHINDLQAYEGEGQINGINQFGPIS